MRTVNSIHIDAPIEDVFQLVADVDRWPDILPHYRWVRTIWRSEDTSLVEMAARRGSVPVKWTSVQHRVRDDHRIYYRHVAGLTSGMWVEWSLARTEEGVEVTITHDLTFSSRIVGSWLGKLIAGRVFIEPIAEKTLEHIKASAEGLSDARAA